MSASLLSRLGSRSDLKDLAEYINAQNMEMYLDIDLISAAKSNAFSSGKRRAAFSAKRRNIAGETRRPRPSEKRDMQSACSA